jgi:hypothetical protein
VGKACRDRQEEELHLLGLVAVVHRACQMVEAASLDEVQ